MKQEADDLEIYGVWVSADDVDTISAPEDPKDPSNQGWFDGFKEPLLTPEEEEALVAITEDIYNDETDSSVPISGMEKQTELLGRIESELSGIRQEISSLRQGVAPSKPDQGSSSLPLEGSKGLLGSLRKHDLGKGDQELRELQLENIIDLVEGDSSEGEGGWTKNLANLPPELREELKEVLTYIDQLMGDLPEEKVHSFAKSRYFDVYKRVFSQLGIG